MELSVIMTHSTLSKLQSRLKSFSSLHWKDIDEGEALLNDDVRR